MKSYIEQLCDSVATSARLYFVASGIFTVGDTRRCKTYDVEMILRAGAEGHEYEGAFFFDVHFTLGVFRDCNGHGICEGECEEIDSSTFTVAMPNQDVAQAVYNHLRNSSAWMPGDTFDVDHDPQFGECGRCGAWGTFPCCNCQARELGL
jgi:hypothetical protein